MAKLYMRKPVELSSHDINHLYAAIGALIKEVNIEASRLSIIGEISESRRKYQEIVELSVLRERIKYELHNFKYELHNF
jgi:hypothetical protein